jgi:hypothetical protein
MTKDSSYIDRYTYEQIDNSLLPKSQEQKNPRPSGKTNISAFAFIDDKNLRKKNDFAMPS